MIRVGILTVSDRSARGERTDLSGPALEMAIAEGLAAAGVVVRDVVPDERELIAARLTRWSDEDGLDLILTTGGTGFATDRGDALRPIGSAGPRGGCAPQACA
jgi:molybdopterin biosynthesis enzyme MoaB